MRHHQEDQLVVVDSVILGAEDVLQNGNRTQPWDAGRAGRVLLVLNAAQDAGLALPQADHLVYGALRDDRLGHAADGHRAALRRDFDFDFQRHVAVEVDSWRHLDIHAHVLVLELGVDQ